MTSFKLSKERKTNLIEILTNIFPEKIIDDRNYWEIDLSGFVIYTKWNPVAEWGESEISIQWFELLLNTEFAIAFAHHIAGKRSIRENVAKFNGIWDSTTLYYELVRQLEWSANFHPVDFFYDLFKTAQNAR